MRIPKPLRLFAVLAALLAALATGAQAQEQEPAPAEGGIAAMITALGSANLSELQQLVSDLTATGNPAVAPALRALGDGDLYLNDDTDAVVIVDRNRMYDPLSGEQIAPVGDNELSKIRVNNSLRVALSTAVGELTLTSDDIATRLSAARSMFDSADDGNLELLNTARAEESDPAV